MASKLVVLALVLLVYKVHSQSIGCISNSQQPYSSQSSCGCGQSQPQTIQLQPTNNNGLKASPQLQITSGQNCNLQAIPLSQLLSRSQGCNQQRGQTGISSPNQNIQVLSTPQISSSCGQCSQPISNCNQASTTLPNSCTTVVDQKLVNSLANALEMMIAIDLMDSANSNNINQDCLTIPVVETSVRSFDLPSFVNNLNANQLQQYRCSGTTQTQSYDCGQNYNLQELQCSQRQPTNEDWSAVLNYLNSRNTNTQCNCGSTINSSKYRGQSAQGQNCYQYPSNQRGNDNDMIEAIKAYLGSSSDSSCGNVAQVVFPEEIPAQLVCNYGYMPTTVPVVSFEVQPCGETNSNFVIGPQPC